MKKYLLTLLILLMSTIIYSQNSVEFTGGVGYTVIDIDKLVAEDENAGSEATDWENLTYGFSGQFIFASTGNIGFGAELMYQYLYWYSVKIPYGYYPIHRSYSVDVTRVTAFLRIGVKSPFTFDVGPEFNFFNELEFGLLTSGNFYIPVSHEIDIPLKARLDILFRKVIVLPISFNAGIRIRL
jgi:hypothetical protein